METNPINPCGIMRSVIIAVITPKVENLAGLFRKRRYDDCANRNERFLAKRFDLEQGVVGLGIACEVPGRVLCTLRGTRACRQTLEAQPDDVERFIAR